MEFEENEIQESTLQNKLLQLQLHFPRKDLVEIFNDAERAIMSMEESFSIRGRTIGINDLGDVALDSSPNDYDRQRWLNAPPNRFAFDKYHELEMGGIEDFGIKLILDALNTNFKQGFPQGTLGGRVLRGSKNFLREGIIDPDLGHDAIKLEREMNEDPTQAAIVIAYKEHSLKYKEGNLYKEEYSKLEKRLEELKKNLEETRDITIKDEIADIQDQINKLEALEYIQIDKPEDSRIKMMFERSAAGHLIPFEIDKHAVQDPNSASGEMSLTKTEILNVKTVKSTGVFVKLDNSFNNDTESNFSGRWFAKNVDPMFTENSLGQRIVFGSYAVKLNIIRFSDLISPKGEYLLCEIDSENIEMNLAASKALYDMKRSDKKGKLPTNENTIKKGNPTDRAFLVLVPVEYLSNS